jgi:hypothetical protein
MYVHTVTVYCFELPAFVQEMPILFYECRWLLAGHRTYLCLLLFMAVLVFFFWGGGVIGVYRFDGSACMRGVFMYRAAEGTEFEVPIAFTRATAPGFWLCIDSASPMLTVAYYDKELLP